MEEKLTHIRKLQDNNYLGEWDLPADNEGKLIMTIKEVKNAEVIGANKVKQIKPLIYFKELPKPLILNATNRKAITAALQSPYIEHWIGKKIELYRLKSLKAFGEILDAVRVKNTPPIVQKPILNESHAKWQNAINSLLDGSQTIESLQNYFQIDSETIKKINEICMQKNSKSEQAQPEK